MSHTVLESLSAFTAGDYVNVRLHVMKVNVFASEMFPDGLLVRLFLNVLAHLLQLTSHGWCGAKSA